MLPPNNWNKAIFDLGLETTWQKLSGEINWAQICLQTQMIHHPTVILVMNVEIP